MAGRLSAKTTRTFRTISSDLVTRRIKDTIADRVIARGRRIDVIAPPAPCGQIAIHVVISDNAGIDELTIHRQHHF